MNEAELIEALERVSGERDTALGRVSELERDLAAAKHAWGELEAETRRQLDELAAELEDVRAELAEVRRAAAESE